MTIHFTLIPVTHYQQNCSLVWCGDTGKAAVIDPGGDVEHLLQRIQAQKLQVEQVLLTHGHIDHAGGARALADHLQVPIVGPHPDETFWLDLLPQQAPMMGFAEVPPLRPDRWLHEGDTVKVGAQTLEVLHCPGHTPGHIVFFHRQDGIAWVGDVLFAGSIGRTDFPRGNYETLVQAIRSKLWPLGDHVRFVPGHGPMSTIGEERRSNPFVADKRFG
ncbi:MBL fold metallo-hydrolase [Saccharophagus sp. K07]|mgnify:CR=1 FL=1|jgi:hydroxyacylglutathione hydrolase|uniref:MBL fold metallo-hydrolase n=1 Tax=Saccharophagus sp. K07 TaxID=2283636 RepID=UPI001CA3468B|nr:MBL fold metallo-hydrolase [Saccharophagus sp. K07]